MGKRLKKSMQQVLAIRQFFFYKYLRLLKKICQKHRDSTSHIKRTVNVLGEGPTKITITNVSIDKQIYKIENTDRKIGFQAFYYVYYSILKHVDVTDRLHQCMRYA